MSGATFGYAAMEEMRARILAEGGGGGAPGPAGPAGPPGPIGDATAATAAADAAKNSAALARSDANAASVAATSAAVAGGVLYPTTTAGLAAVAEGAYFNVAGDGAATYAITWRKVSGAAVEVARYPSKAALDGVSASTTTAIQGFDARVAVVEQINLVLSYDPFGLGWQHYDLCTAEGKSATGAAA